MRTPRKKQNCESKTEIFQRRYFRAVKSLWRAQNPWSERQSPKIERDQISNTRMVLNPLLSLLYLYAPRINLPTSSWISPLSWNSAFFLTSTIIQPNSHRLWKPSEKSIQLSSGLTIFAAYWRNSKSIPDYSNGENLHKRRTISTHQDQRFMDRNP